MGDKLDHKGGSEVAIISSTPPDDVDIHKGQEDELVWGRGLIYPVERLFSVTGQLYRTLTVGHLCLTP